MSSVVGSFMAAESASAATELAQIAARDNRFGLLLTLAAPALGWVLFNIGAHWVRVNLAGHDVVCPASPSAP